MHLVGGAAVELEVARQRQRVGAAWRNGLPTSSASSGASSSACASTSADMRISTRPRSAAPSRPHSPSSAARAACTAASMSAAVPRAICASGVPSEGLSSGSVRAPAHSRHWPAMNTPRLSKLMLDMAAVPAPRWA
jgi:hypothetical protein